MTTRANPELMELKTNRIGTVPHLAEGSALVTLLAFHRRTGAATNSRVSRDFYGARDLTPNPPNLFGIGFEDVATRIFGGAVSGDDLLNRHTLFGFYSRLLPVEARRMWKADLAAYHGGSFGTYLETKFGPLTSLGAAGALRKCRACVDADSAAGLIPSWRVLHQIPFLHRCPDHGELLHTHCPACSRPYGSGTDYRLPGDQCPHCGHAEGPSGSVHASKGQILLGDLCKRIFRGLVPDLTPENWSKWVDRTARTLGGIERATARIEGLIVSLWDIESIERLSDCLGVALPDSFVRAELRQEVSPRVWLPRLALYSAVESVAIADAFRPAQQMDEASGPIGSRRVQIYLLATRHGVPRAAVDRMLAGDSLSSIAGARTVTVQMLQAFRRSLPRHFAGYASEFREKEKFERRIKNEAKTAKHEALRTFRRKVLLDALSVNPNLSISEAEALFQDRCEWLRRHDLAWFDSVLPNRRPEFSSTLGQYSRFGGNSQRREAYRQEVLEFVQANPATGRTELYANLRGSMNWLVTNDRAWCDENVPLKPKSKSDGSWYQGARPIAMPDTMLKGRYRDESERTSIAQAYILEAMKLNPHLTRTELARLCSGPVTWLKSKYPEWLERVLPKRLK